GKPGVPQRREGHRAQVGDAELTRCGALARSGACAACCLSWLSRKKNEPSEALKEPMSRCPLVWPHLGWRDNGLAGRGGTTVVGTTCLENLGFGEPGVWRTWGSDDLALDTRSPSASVLGAGAGRRSWDARQLAQHSEPLRWRLGSGVWVPADPQCGLSSG